MLRAQDDDDFDMETLKRYVEASKRREEKAIRVSHWDAPNEVQSVQELMTMDELAKSLKEQGRAEISEIGPNSVPNELADCHARLDGKRIGAEVTELIEPFEHWADWPLERFRKKLAASIDKKDRKSGKPGLAPALSRLHQLWLVVATDDERAGYTAFEVQWLAEPQRPGKTPPIQWGVYTGRVRRLWAATRPTSGRRLSGVSHHWAGVACLVVGTSWESWPQSGQAPI